MQLSGGWEWVGVGGVGVGGCEWVGCEYVFESKIYFEFIISFLISSYLCYLLTRMAAAHTLEQVDRCVDAFIEVGKERGVIAK